MKYICILCESDMIPWIESENKIARKWLNDQLLEKFYDDLLKYNLLGKDQQANFITPLKNSPL